MGQKCLDLGPTHIARGARGMEQDKPPHQIDVGILGADAAMQPANTGAHLIKQQRFAAAPDV